MSCTLHFERHPGFRYTRSYGLRILFARPYVTIRTRVKVLITRGTRSSFRAMDLCASVVSSRSCFAARNFPTRNSRSQLRVSTPRTRDFWRSSRAGSQIAVLASEGATIEADSVSRDFHKLRQSRLRFPRARRQANRSKRVAHAFPSARRRRHVGLT